MLKSFVKHSVSIIGISVCFVLSYLCFNYVLTDDTASYTRITMHQFYDQDNIDILFLGSSHCYRSLDTAITDKMFKVNTFNGGTSAQEMDGSLAIAKEAIKNNDIKQIYLEMLYSIAEAKPRKERTQLTSTYIISDYLHPGLNKIGYLINASSKKFYVNSFLIPVRNRNKITDLGYIKELVQKKQSHFYKNYKWNKDTDPYEYYVNKGFVASEYSLKGQEIWTNQYYAKEFDSVSDEWERDVKKIAELCRQNNIKLTLFVSPISEWSVLSMENYDRYRDIVSRLAKECSVEYYDFNYCDSKLFDSSNPGYYKDNNHLNYSGAEAFSYLFCDFMTGKINNKEMYDTIQDKVKHEEPRLLGLSKLEVEEEEDMGKPTRIKIISNKPDMEYRIYYQDSTGKTKIIREFDFDRYFSIPSDKGGIIKVDWRMPDSPSIVNTEIFTY